MRKLLITGAVLLSACSDGSGPAPSGPPKVGVPVVVPAASRQSLTVEGGDTGGEYVLVPFYADSFYVNAADANGTRKDTTHRKLTLTVSATGVAPVAGPPLPSLAPTVPGLLASRAAAPGGAALDLRPDDRFHLALRHREQRDLAGRMASLTPTTSSSAGAARLSRASLAVASAVPVVGQLVPYNTRADSVCNSPDVRTGRVAAISDRTIIVADTANPIGGFTTADYQSFAAQFDTLVYKVDTDNFGTPGDVDANGHVVIFFTRAVNELTKSGSDSYVGGFFFGRDLFPTAPDTKTGYPGCAGSNEAEMFYMLVPDPAGVVNGNVRTVDFVRSQTTGVLAHEFQHLINEYHRLYVNDAPEYEDVWLNEGLSHIAEELMFYRVSGLAPRTNITITQVEPGAPYAAAFNSYQGANFSRLQRYYVAPDTNSPYADNDELETRGATWQMLRYLIDRKGGDPAVTTRALVNTKAWGVRNLQNVFGADGLSLVRDYTVALYADDAGAVLTAALQQSYNQPSWNYRAIFPRYAVNKGQFPLKTWALAGGPQTITLAGGGAAYLRFSVPANATATVNTTTSSSSGIPAGLQMTLLRTK